MAEVPVKAKTTILGGIEVSQVAFGTEHINQYLPEFGGAILRDAAVNHNVFFWDTDNEYGSQPQVAAGLRMVNRGDVVICSKSYANTEEEAERDLNDILEELGTDYLDIYLLHCVDDDRYKKMGGAIEGLRKLKEQGRVRRIGLSTHSNFVGYHACEIEGFDILCMTLNRDGSRIDPGGTIEGQIAALKRAHEAGMGTYVIKTIGRGDLLHDLRNALNWIMENHEYIDAYNIGVSNLRELQQDIQIVNDYYEERGLQV